MENDLIFAWKKDGEQVRMPPLEKLGPPQVAWSHNNVHAYVRIKPSHAEISRHPENIWTDDSGELFELACVGPAGNCRWTYPAKSDSMRKMHPEIAEQLNCRPWLETEPDGQGGRRPT